MTMNYNLIYYHRLRFPSASGQTIAIIRDFYAVSRLIGQVHLFYRAPQAFEEKRLNQLLENYGGHVDDKFHFHCIPEGWFGKRRIMRMASSLLHSSELPFVMTARTFDHARVGLKLKNRCRNRTVKVVMELHQEPFPHVRLKKEKKPIKALRKYLAAKRIYEQTDALLCNTRPQVDLLDQLFPDHSPIKYLPSGCPDSFFDSDEKQVSPGKNDSKIHIRYAGRFSTWKNPALMFAALRHLPENYVLDVAGGKLGDEQKGKRIVKETASRFQVQDRVNYYGFLPPVKVVDFLKGADCLLLPLGRAPEGKLFTSPLKLFEYAASGRPMAVTRVPSTENLIKDGVHAVMAEPDSASDTARAIRKIMRDKELAKRIGENARNWARQYSVKNRATEYVAFLDTLL